MDRGAWSYPEAVRSSLARYLDLLYAESDRLNLTSVPRRQAWSRHVEESLDLVPARRWLLGERVLDLGSGGGTPGIPLVIAQPQIALGLIERDRAKATFLLRCCAELGLTSVRVFSRDAIELARSDGFQTADVLVSRAAVPAPRLLALAGSLLRAGGEGLVHVGRSVSVDLDLSNAAARAGLTELRIETFGSSRLLRFVRLPAG